MAFEGNTGDGIMAGMRIGASVKKELPNPAFWSPASIRRRADGYSLAASTSVHTAIQLCVLMALSLVHRSAFMRKCCMIHLNNWATYCPSAIEFGSCNQVPLSSASR
jgi:hypothetical protein